MSVPGKPCCQACAEGRACEGDAAPALGHAPGKPCCQACAEGRACEGESPGAVGFDIDKAEASQWQRRADLREPPSDLSWLDRKRWILWMDRPELAVRNAREGHPVAIRAVEAMPARVVQEAEAAADQLPSGPGWRESLAGFTMPSLDVTLPHVDLPGASASSSSAAASGAASSSPAAAAPAPTTTADRNKKIVVGALGLVGGILAGWVGYRLVTKQPVIPKGQE